MNAFAKTAIALVILISAVLFLLSLGKKTVDNAQLETTSPVINHRIFSDSWNIFRGDRQLSGVAKGALPNKLTLGWKFNAGSDVKSSPVISAGRVYFSSTEGQVYCVSLNDGKKLWSVKLPDSVEASACIVHDIVCIGCADGYIYALAADSGKEKWKFQTEDEILASANSFEDQNGTRIIFGSYDSSVYCIDAENGELAWKYETDNYINGTPAISGQLAAVGGCDANIHVINISDGTAVTQIDSGAYIASSATMLDGRVYVGNYDNVFLCADVTSGKILWEYKDAEGPILSSPAVNQNSVVFGAKDKFLYCLEKDSGKEKWKFKALGDFDSSPVICGDRIVVGCEDGRVYMLNINDGSKVWEYETGNAITSSCAIAAGKVVVGCDDGYVYAFEIEGEKK